MFNIDKYLEKFSKSIKSKDLYNNKILEVIKKSTNLELKDENIELKDYVLIIKSSSGVKNKIFIYKNKILDDLKKEIPDKIIDIR